jgi:hypothetical protein
MNVSRRLFRAWIFVSVLWLLGTIAYACFVFPSQMADARYQYVYEMRADVDVDNINKIDWNNKSIYELMRSPSLETLTPAFDQLEEQYWSDWDQGIKKGELKKLTYPHGNLYLSADLTQADQSYHPRGSGAQPGR